MTMCFPAFLEAGITRPGLFIIISQIVLRHKSIINDIIPITDKKRLKTKSCKKFASDFVTSFTVDIDDFVISYFEFSFWERMKISQIVFKKIRISFTFHHNNLIYEKYLGKIFKFK